MTGKMIKLELRKAFTAPWFFLSLAVLLLCALMSTVYNIDSYLRILHDGFPHYFENGKMTVNEYYATWNCYQKWIGSELVSLASTLFLRCYLSAQCCPTPPLSIRNGKPAICG